MYKIRNTDYGYYMTVTGEMSKVEADLYLNEFHRLGSQNEPRGGMILDLRDLTSSEPLIMQSINKGICLAKDAHLQRVAVIINSAIFKRKGDLKAFMSNTDETVKFFDIIKMEDCDKFSHDWVVQGIEPLYDATFSTADFFIRGRSAIPK